MNRSELLSFLAEIGRSPRKSLSQNFLIDENIVAKIAHLADIQPGDKVLEIGPGAGAITEYLLNQGATVLAIEKDSLFAEHLERLQNGRLQVQCADFLKFPIETLGPHWKVVSNLPYQITAPSLELLLNHSAQFSTLTLVVQKEVGERIGAKPRTKEFGSLTLFIQFYAAVTGSFPIASNSFYPKPKVESIALRLTLRPPPPVDEKAFFTIMRKAFQQRRKMIATSLRSLFPQINEALRQANLSEKARPEELSLEEWVKLVNALANSTNAEF